MEDLIRRRGRAKGKLTRICSFAEQTDLSSMSSADIKIRLEMLGGVWTEFDGIQMKIECDCSETELAAQQAEQEDFESKFYHVKGALMDILDQQMATASSLNTINQQTNTVIPPALPSSTFKLPTINLPTFNGDYLKWTSFSDLFKSVIHNNPSLGPAQKLHYLKSSVKGDAEKLLSSIAVTDANYAEAWTILTERFSNKRQIVASHLKSIYSQSKIHVESSRDIRHLLDTTVENLRALHALGLPTEHWDCLTVFAVTERLDSTTRQNWELESANVENPTFTALKTFLEKRCRALEVSPGVRKSLVNNNPVKPTYKPVAHAATYHANSTNTSKDNSSCMVCGATHQLFRCEKFLSLPVSQRISHIKEASLCFNCLRAGHSSRNCKSSKCRKCQQSHNTLLHYQSPTIENASGGPVMASHHVSHLVTPYQVLLATAVVTTEDSWGALHSLRTLLDAGSQVSFITASCVRGLGLKVHKSSVNISGVGASTFTLCNGATSITIRSMCTDFQIQVYVLILKQITGTLPSHPISDSNLQKAIHANDLTLADGAFDKPGKIDLLLGADVYYRLLLSGQVTIKSSKLALQNTSLGWIVAGPSGTPTTGSSALAHLVTEDLNHSIKRFWEIENIPQPRPLNPEDRKCEDHFRQTHSRDWSGRFVVMLPFKLSQDSLGDSRPMAVSRWLQVERKLSNHPELATEYHKFMKEYLELGHMELIHCDITNLGTYYLPHHFVLRDQSRTTKLRVVFDGSAQPTRGISLNQALMVGPPIQNELTNIIVRFRMHNYVWLADIAKMYRQVMMHPAHRDYQRIVWRASPSEPLCDYRLCTVTYGTSAAPFLAVRSLVELASVGATTHPIAARIIREDCYVDDILTGANTLEEALSCQSQLIDLLGLGKFELHKWAANHPDLLINYHKNMCDKTAIFDLGEGLTKTLGIFWCSDTDCFMFRITDIPITNISKRAILSQICKLFDPLGWVAPVVLVAKVLIQRLWLVSAGWDDDLPVSVVEQWKQYTYQLRDLESIKIPRSVVIDSASRDLQLHGFCDASELAYGAVIFIRSVVGDSVGVHLVCSKSRVAPLKKVTLPRLELCGAVLLGQLLNRIRLVMNLDLDKTYAWTDSTIVLGWLNGAPHSWKTFVANRVVETVDLIPAQHWHHIASQDNPADCLSRGMSAGTLKEHSLWWHGPSWLSVHESDWGIGRVACDTVQLPENESRKDKPIICLINIKTNWSLTSYSSLSRLLHITAYVLRFINNCRKTSKIKYYGWLTEAEVRIGLYHWIRVVQGAVYQNDIKQCTSKLPLHKHSSLLSLNPFIDSSGLLRVGGRLQSSHLAYDQKHPIILPPHHHLTRLIITDQHIRDLHSGIQLLLATLRCRFWIVHARREVKKVIHQCIKCFKLRASTSQQLMGSLPSHRVQPIRPFIRCGIDYAGPITTRSATGRGRMKTYKTYICIFICFATRAIHIELVGDLSTASFIAALRRFCARRGHPADIYSDCGTNFVGANRELTDWYTLMSSHCHNQETSMALAHNGIKWHFNPPSTPHFGGLWEAGVRSIKHHLRRTMGLSLLTYEEANTILIQIEASLNSRPLCPMSDSPDDLTVLTPGHFLITESLAAIADPNALDIAMNRLPRWRMIQKIFQHFWQRWSGEYLARLQQRPKWTGVRSNVRVGDLVLVKEDYVSPLKWPLARIMEIHPGLDDVVRVVTLRTSKGTYKRPITKCCPLPCSEEGPMTSDA